MTTQITSNEYHQTYSSQKNKRSDEISRGIEETEAISIEKRQHLSPRKKESRVTVANLDDDLIVKEEEEVKIPYAKSKFGKNNIQSASKGSNFSSFETKGVGIKSQKTYEDSFSDRVDMIPNR